MAMPHSPETAFLYSAFMSQTVCHLLSPSRNILIPHEWRDSTCAAYTIVYSIVQLVPSVLFCLITLNIHIPKATGNLSEFGFLSQNPLRVISSSI